MPSGFLLTGALNLFCVLILIASTQFLPTAYKYSISVPRVNINLNVFLSQFGSMFIGVKPLLHDFPPVIVHPCGLFWTVFGKPRHEPARGVVGGLFATVKVSIEQYPVFYGVSGGFVRARNNMMCFEVICAA